MYLETLIGIVKDPKHFSSFAGLPGQFDAAEELKKDWWELLKTADKKAVIRVLVKSGKYIAIKN